MSRSLADRGHVAATPQVITDQTIREVDPSLVVVRLHPQGYDHRDTAQVDFVICSNETEVQEAFDAHIGWYERMLGTWGGIPGEAFVLSELSAWRRWEDERKVIEEQEEEIDI